MHHPTRLQKGTIMHKITRRIASASARHPWRTITGWLAVMGAVFFLAIAAGGTFVDDFSSPGSQSATALELLDENFPEAAKGSAMVVLAARDGTTLDEHQDAIAQVLDDVSGFAHVESVADPFESATISEDGRIGFAVINLDAPEREIGKPAFGVLSEAVSSMGAPGLQVELGGDAVFLNAAEETSFHTAIGLLVALVVLLVVFGTVVAAIVPIGMSLVAVGASIGGIMLMASTMNVSVSAIAVAGLVGLGVGVDYALFIVARYREGRSAGRDNARALSNAMATSGTAVVFAGGIVMIATAALGITGLGILTSIGLSTALMVLVAVAAAVTLLPALLTLLGDRIDAGRVVRRHRPAVRTEDSAWWRFGHHVSRRPWPYLLGSVAMLAALAAPALSIQTAFPAAGDAPAHTTHRQAYDLLTEGFGIGFNAPLTVVMDLESPTAGADDVATVSAAIADVPGIVSVGAPQTSEDGGTVVFSALPDGGPADAETSATIERVRAVIPDNTYVSGITAITDDLNSQLRKTLPLFVGVVIGISFLLLMLVFRSVAVPLKAAVMNLLSIGAAYGVLVAVFQWGGGRAVGARWADPHHLAHHRDHVPDPVRALDGLRGLPALAHQGGVRRDGRQRRVGRSRPGRDGADHHLGRAHHDRRLPQLRLQPGPLAQDARPRTCHGDRDRRHPDPHGPGARDHVAARRRQLVASPVAGQGIAGRGHGARRGHHH